MRIGLVSYRCENRNIAFNMSQIELAMKRAEGKAEMLCFGEAFLQGFDALCWDYDTDKEVAQLWQLTVIATVHTCDDIPCHMASIL